MNEEVVDVGGLKMEVAMAESGKNKDQLKEATVAKFATNYLLTMI